MLNFNRIDVFEGIDVIKQVHEKSVIFVTIGISCSFFLGGQFDPFHTIYLKYIESAKMLTSSVIN